MTGANWRMVGGISRSALPISRTVAPSPAPLWRMRAISAGAIAGSRTLRAVSRIEPAEKPAPITNAAMVT